MLEFVIPGRPQAWQRTNSVLVQGKLRKVTPKSMKQAQAVVARLAQVGMRGLRPFTGPLKLEVLCIYAIPPSWPKAKQEAARAGLVWKTTVPDSDNLAKLVSDALNGIAWGDDAQVVHQTSAKRYGHPERTVVRVTLLDRFCDHTPSASFKAWAAEQRALASPQGLLAIACNTISEPGSEGEQGG